VRSPAGTPPALPPGFTIEGDSLRAAFGCNGRLRGPLETMSADLVELCPKLPTSCDMPRAEPQPVLLVAP